MVRCASLRAHVSGPAATQGLENLSRGTALGFFFPPNF